MRNPGFRERSPAYSKAEPEVKANGMCLRMQADRVNAAAPCLVQQASQQGTSYAFFSPRLEYGHASYGAIRQQSGGSDRIAARIQRQQMNAACSIMFIPFEFDRDPLFADENRLTHLSERLAVMFPVGDAYCIAHCYCVTLRNARAGRQP